MHGFAYDANLFLGDADPDFPGPLSFAQEITTAKADIWTNSWNFDVDAAWTGYDLNKDGET